MTSIIPAHYQDFLVAFNENGWFNATQAAAYYGKRPVDWLRLDETKQYIAILADIHKVSQDHFVKTRRGTKSPGTWFHPNIAVAFARWCDQRFAVWCDLQIHAILRGTHPHYDWKKMRHQAASSTKTMSEALRIVREGQAKATATHHYANEARLINFIMAGKFTGLDRDGLTDSDLALLAHLETRNSVLIGQGLDYQTRKALLKVYAMEQRPVHPCVIDGEWGIASALGQAVREVIPDE